VEPEGPPPTMRASKAPGGKAQPLNRPFLSTAGGPRSAPTADRSTNGVAKAAPTARGVGTSTVEEPIFTGIGILAGPRISLTDGSASTQI
jgi:hypothetical protein